MWPILFGRVPWKFIGTLALGALLLFAGWKVSSWHSEAQRVQELKNTLESERAQYKAAMEASKEFQDELETLRKRPVHNDPVRLCVKSTVPTVNPGSSETVSAPGVVSGSDGINNSMREGPDIGPALRRLAQRADEINAQGRAIQGRDNGQ